MIRKLLIAFSLGLAVVLPYIGVATTTNTTAAAAGAPLLPGEPTLSNAAPAYDFGFNNGIEYGTPNFSTDAGVQAQVKAAGLTIDRIWAPYESPGTNAMDSGDITDFTNHIDAALNSGAACYVEMGEVDNLPLLEQEVNFAEPKGCHMFEFGNELDTAHSSSVGQYTTQWNTDIPALRALSVCAGTATVSSGCLFGGPTVAYATQGDGTSAGAGYSSAAAYWMAKLDKTTAFPDFVSWHQYPCNGADGWDSTQALDKSDCLEAATSTATGCASDNTCNVSLPYAQSLMLGWEQQYLGKEVPTGISETNFDPGSGTLAAWSADDNFLSQYETATLNSFTANHFSFAMEYTAMDDAGNGDLDMFCDWAGFDSDPACTAQGSPKGQFEAMASEREKYGAPTTSPVPPPPPSTTHGYWLVGADGGIFTFGASLFYGSTGNLRLVRPVVGITPTADHHGYWLAASDGGIFSFGDTTYFGSIPGLGLNAAGSGLPNSLDAPIVGMVPSADGRGYFLVGADGGVFTFGDARYEGSCPGIGGCVGDAIAVMADATGNGYWVVTSVGSVYTFGDAQYYGAPGNVGVPVTSAAAAPDGRGYRILFANGAIFDYGDAANLGSPSSANFGSLDPANAIFPTDDGTGYWVASAEGNLFTFGDAPNSGGTSALHLNAPIIAGTGY